MSKNKQHRVKPKEAASQKVIPFQNPPPVVMQQSTKENEATHIIRQKKDVPGVIEIVLEHECKKTSGSFRSHVKIPPEEWNKVLAFFKWTYDTWKSEAQVRLFANTTNGTIIPWAFPQKADTGMTAKEIEDHANFAPQRAQFPDPEWLYFGTAHHHCNGGAFQSWTDRDDEHSKDGLHITIGKLGGDEYDIHSRLCLLKNQWTNPDMSLFFNVAGIKEEMFPGWSMKFAPPDDVIARMLMCQPAPAETVIPQEWKDNVITPPPVIHVPTHSHPPHWSDSDFNGHGGNSWHNGYHEGKREYLDRSSQTFDVDLLRALSDLGNYMKRQNDKNQGTKNWRPMTREYLFNIFECINQLMDDDMMNVFDILARHDLRAESMMKFWRDKVVVKEKETKQLKLPETKSNGVNAGEDLSEPDPCPHCGQREGRHTVNCEVIKASLMQRGSLPE